MAFKSDSNSVLVLPSRIAFKSEDSNGNYLGSISLYDNLIYQKFESGLDIGDPRVIKELFITADGNYRIKDSYSGKFWRRRDNWIKAEADDQSGDTLFSFVQIKDNVVALRNLGNKKFCGAYTEAKSINCLCAIYPTLSRQTRLIVEEPVIQRKISDLKYRLSDSRIYNQQIQEVDHQFGSNNSTRDNTMTLSFSTTDSRTTSWNNSVSISLGVSVTFETTIVPFIEKANIKLSAQVGYTHEWGGSVTKEHTRKTSYTITVAPLTIVKVTMLATTAVCDVPFSYTQRDLLATGEWVETRKDDGLFTGINSYNIHYQSDVVNSYDIHYQSDIVPRQDNKCQLL